MLDTLEGHLKDGIATSIAEVHVNSRTSAPRPILNRKVPADSTLMVKLMGLSAGEYEQVDSIRLGLLARLAPATAEKVAYQNGVRLFRLK